MLQTLVNLARPLFLSVLPQQDSALLEQINALITRILQYVFCLLITSVLLVIIATFLIDRALIQLDAGQFVFTPSIILLSVLFVIDAAILAFLLFKKSPKPQPQNTTKPTPSLEDAVSVLIVDVVNERKAQRRERGPSSTTANE